METHTKEQWHRCKKMQELLPCQQSRQVVLPAIGSTNMQLQCTLSGEQAQKVKPVQLVDVPGHPKVRSRFEGHIDGARGIIFVVDSVDFMGQKTTVAE